MPKQRPPVPKYIARDESSILSASIMRIRKVKWRGYTYYIQGRVFSMDKGRIMLRSRDGEPNKMVSKSEVEEVQPTEEVDIS